MERRGRPRQRGTTCGELVPNGGMALIDLDTMRRRLGRLQPIDWWTLAYVGLATVALSLSFSDGPIAGWPWLVLGHALLASLVLLAPRVREASPIGRFLGDWYQMLLLAGLYGEIGVLTLHAGFQHDAAIQQLEAWVF